MKRHFAALAVALSLMTPAAALAEDTMTTAALQAVLKNQERILQTLEEIKAELAIVKVRATQR